MPAGPTPNSILKRNVSPSRASLSWPSLTRLVATVILTLICLSFCHQARSEVVNHVGVLDQLDNRLAETRDKGKHWFLAEYDFDDRGFNVLHFMGHSPLPLGFSLWGFIDIEGEDFLGEDREDLSRYFLELDLKREIWNGVGVVAEINDLQGPDNAIGRFGVFWKPDTSWLSPTEGPIAGQFRFAIKYFPVETDMQGGQFSFNWNKNFDNIFDGRFSAGGFFDLNYGIGDARDIRIVTEHQVRFRIAEGLHAITEFRVNEFLADDFGIAPGIQYRF